MIDVRGKNQQAASFVIDLVSAKFGWQFQAIVPGIAVLVREAPRIIKTHRAAVRELLRRITGVYAEDSRPACVLVMVQGLEATVLRHVEPGVVIENQFRKLILRIIRQFENSAGQRAMAKFREFLYRLILPME